MPRCYFDLRDMLAASAEGSYPCTPAIGLIEGLRASVTMLLEEGLDNVYARHHRICEGVRRAVAAWNLPVCARRPELNSDTVTAIMVPESFDSTELVNHVNDAYGVAFGIGLGQVAGRLFRIGHLGQMSDAMAPRAFAARRSPR